MRHLPFLYVFLSLFAYSIPVLGQTEDDDLTSTSPQYNWNKWQSEMLSQIDPDLLDARSYAQLLEMIYNLEIENHLSDSIASQHKPMRVKQQYIAGLKSSPLSFEQFPQTTIRYDLNAHHNNGSKWRMGAVIQQKEFDHWKETPLWADHVSLYASYDQTKGWVRQAVVGHYRLNLGCGLLCNQQFSLGKEVAASTFFQHRPDLTVHASSLDEGYMQGAAARLRLGAHCEIIPFLSALQTEIKGQSRARWNTHAGARVRWMGEQYAIAANLLHTSSPDGTRLLQSSIDYQLQWMNCFLKGETAIDDAGGWSTINAIQGNIADRWDLTAMYRHYNDRYKQRSGNSVSESSSMQGEHGITLVTEGELSRYWTLQATADWYEFTLPQYGICLPSQGYDLSARACYERKRRHHLWRGWIGYRVKAKYRNDTSTPEHDIIPYYRHSLDAQLSWLSPLGVTLQSQLHTRLYSAQNVEGTQLGYALSQMAGYTLHSLPLMYEIQATWFHTDAYDCRLYLSERNMLHAFSIPMLNGEGTRWSAYLRYKPNSSLSCELKYALSRHSNSSNQALFVQISKRF